MNDSKGCFEHDCAMLRCMNANFCMCLMQLSVTDETIEIKGWHWRKPLMQIEENTLYYLVLYYLEVWGGGEPFELEDKTINLDDEE